MCSTKNNDYEINNNNNKLIDITVNGKKLSVKYNTRVSELRLSELPCGGHGKCGKCKVKVSGDVSPLTENEKAFLTEAEIKAGVRLGCYTFILGSCKVEKIVEADNASVLTGGAKGEIKLSPSFRSLGIAIDIGTTTVAARLISPSGETLSEYGSNNPQSLFGADVVSRIEAHLAGNGEALSELIVGEINKAVTSLCKRAEKSAEEIDGISITGNTVMLYLLTNTSPEPLSHAPFTLTRGFGETLKASELNLSSVRPETEIYLPPCISAFVGADTVCAILTAAPHSEVNTDLVSSEKSDSSVGCPENTPDDLANGIESKPDGLTDSAESKPDGLTDGIENSFDASVGYLENKKTAVLADIGTNGEMALWKNGKLFVCSTAAGPAFEGVGISRGMRGEAGAIDKVALVNGRLSASVIGGGEPKGICGSGLVDAVAALLDTGDIDETGYLEDDEVTVLSPITLTDKDIRAVQLAKSAISAGIRTLINEAGTDISELSSLFIAGGFGNYLNKVSAGRIGLLPVELVEKTENIGNAALIGAEMLLLNKDLRSCAEELSRKAVTVELSTNKYFSDSFISGMLFE